MRIIFFDLPMNYILRSPRFRVASATSSYHRRHTVAVAINIHQLAILANSIAAHQIGVAQQGIAHQLLLFLRSFGNFPIDNRVALFARSLE